MHCGCPECEKIQVEIFENWRQVCFLTARKLVDEHTGHKWTVKRRRKPKQMEMAFTGSGKHCWRFENGHLGTDANAVRRLSEALMEDCLVSSTGMRQSVVKA